MQGKLILAAAKMLSPCGVEVAGVIVAQAVEDGPWNSPERNPLDPCRYWEEIGLDQDAVPIGACKGWD